MANYRQFIKDKCELCGCSDKRILNGHHKDRDRTNNSPNNIQTLCMNCHYITHFEMRLKDKDMIPNIYETPNGMIRAVFPNPIKEEWQNYFLLALGHRRGNKIFTRKEDRKVIGFECTREDFENMLGRKI